MFNLFKERPRDVKGIRNILLQFIKERLQRVQGGEGANIMGIYLFINCSDHDRHLYEAAVFTNIPGKFKNDEVQKIADDYDIVLSSSWKFEVSFTVQYPAQADIVPGIDAALFISTRKSGLGNNKKRAFIKVLSGQAENETYLLDASDGRINIGREAKVLAEEVLSAKMRSLLLRRTSTVQSAGNMHILNGNPIAVHSWYIRMKVEFHPIIK